MLDATPSSSSAGPTLFWMLLRRPVKHNIWAHAPSIKWVSLKEEKMFIFLFTAAILIIAIPSKKFEFSG